MNQRSAARSVIRLECIRPVAAGERHLTRARCRRQPAAGAHGGLPGVGAVPGAGARRRAAAHARRARPRLHPRLQRRAVRARPLLQGACARSRHSLHSLHRYSFRFSREPHDLAPRHFPPETMSVGMYNILDAPNAI
jgi:hypothetical protein